MPVKIRVLIVDDSVIVRRLLSQWLAEDPALEVVAAAANGRLALARIQIDQPHVVVLDMEMPEMGGLETLAVLRRDFPGLPVVMFSSLTERGAAATLDALALGAADYATKPANVQDLRGAQDRVRDELIPKVKALGTARAAAQAAGEAAREAAARAAATGSTCPLATTAPEVRVDVVAVGVSTGGPNALERLLPALPVDLPVPLVIVQHMPPQFTRLLAERLATKTALAVREGKHGEPLRPGTAWIAPGDQHMEVARQRGETVLRTHRGEPENSCRPSVDVLFRSVAQVYVERSLAVVLTGMGQDGLLGCERIRQAGGHVVVQDEKSSVVWGMPGFVARAGLADKVVALERMADEIVRRTRVGREGPAAR